jgi:hypothetical protein
VSWQLAVAAVDLRMLGASCPPLVFLLAVGAREDAFQEGFPVMEEEGFLVMEEGFPTRDFRSWRRSVGNHGGAADGSWQE